MRRSSNALHRFIRSERLRRAAHDSEAISDLASTWVAGELVTDAVFTAADLRRKGLEVSFAHIAPADDELGSPRQLRSLLTSLGPDARGAELSVKPTSLGLEEDPARAAAELAGLCRDAESAGAHVTLEMEDHDTYQPTLELYQAVVADHPMLGITIPVNIRRAEADVVRLAAQRARVRLCVGSYPAPTAVSIRSEHEKSLALVRCVRIMLESHAYLMLATHDPRIVTITHELARRHDRPTDSYEFQMLLGVRPLEQRRLTDIGLTSRTYIPFGPGWYEYFATRIAARPRTLWSYLRALLDKR